MAQRGREVEHVIVIIVQTTEETDEGTLRCSGIHIGLTVLQVGTISDAPVAQRIIDEARILQVVHLVAGALPAVA